VAHRGNVGLVKEELGSVAPAIAVLGLLLREGQHVVGCIANSAQDGPVLETLIAMSRATIDLGMAGDCGKWRATFKLGRPSKRTTLTLG